MSSTKISAVLLMVINNADKHLQRGVKLVLNVCLWSLISKLQREMVLNVHLPRTAQPEQYCATATISHLTIVLQSQLTK